MKSITSKISVITLALLACTFTFVLGTTSSKAVGHGNLLAQAVVHIPGFDFGGSPWGCSGAVSVSNREVLNITCSRQYDDSPVGVMHLHDEAVIATPPSDAH